MALLPRLGTRELSTSAKVAIGSGFFLGLMPLTSYGQGGCGAANNVTGSPTSGGAHGEGNANLDGGTIELNFYAVGAFSAFMTTIAGLSIAIAGTEIGGGANYRVPRRFTGNEVLPGAFNFQPILGSYWQLVEETWEEVNDADAFNPGESGYIAVRKGNNYGFVSITVANPMTASVVLSAYNVNLSGISNHTGGVQVGNCTSLGTPLPVELSFFNAKPQGDWVKLNWQTESESGNAGFEIQRSNDGKTFKSIAWVDGHGDSDVVIDYYYDDKALRDGQTYYYRLKQIDYDGQFEFSDMVVVILDSKHTQVGEVFPNPVDQGQFTLEIAAKTSLDWTISLYDISGRLHHQEVRQVAEGFNRMDFTFPDLKKGSFFLKLENGTERIYRKLILK